MKYKIIQSYQKHCIDFQVLLCFIILCLSLQAQPPGNPVYQNPKIAFYDNENTGQFKCFDLDIETGLNAIINTDCFQEITFTGKIFKNVCNCTSFTIDINGKPLREIAIDEVPQFTISHQEILQSIGINFPANQPILLPIAIGFTCVTMSPGTNPAAADKTVTKSLNLTIVADGMEYDKIVSKKADQLLGITKPAAVSSTAICCSPHMVKTLSFTKNKIVNNTFLSNVLVSTPGETIRPIGVKVLPIEWQPGINIIPSNDPMSIKPLIYSHKGIANGCLDVALQIKGDIYDIQKFRANCTSGDIQTGPVKRTSVPGHLTAQAVSVTPAFANCPAINRPPTESISQDQNSCKMTLNISDITVSDIDFVWTNDKGEIVPSKRGDLVNVPAGKYTLTLSNLFCEAQSYMYLVCDNISETTYTQNFGDTWCKDILCMTANCVETYKMCIIPDRVENDFDIISKMCIKNYYYNGEFIGKTSTEANYETKWDKIFGECVTTYFCNGDGVYEDDYQPEETEWLYDEFWEECKLTVKCNGEEIVNADQTNAVIEWQWDEFWEECESNYIFCNGEYAENTVSVQPYIIYDWEFSSFSGCFREIECLSGGGSIQQEIEPDFEDTNSQGRCDDGEIEWTVLCDGEEVDYVCLTLLQQPTLMSRIKERSKNVRISQLGSDVNIKIKRTNQLPLTVKIYDVIGKIAKEKNFSYNEDKIDINIEDVISGLYIISVMENGVNIHSEKIFIQ